MADDLKIFISARLDMNQSIKDINKQILALSTNLNLRKLHLNIAVDGAIVKTLKSITTATDKLNALLSQNKAITNNVSSYKRLNTVIGSINRNMQSHNDLTLKSKMASESNKNAVQAETTQQEKQKRTLQRLDRQTQQLVATRRTLANTPANHSSAPSPSSANHSYNQGGVIQDKGPSLIRRMESWNIAMIALRTPLQRLQSGAKYVTELDTAMSNLTRATNASSIEIQNFLGDANGVANEIGGLTVNVINSATEWANLGYSINQSKALAKQTLVLQNVGDFDSVEQASKALLSTIKGFGIEVDNEGKNVANIVDIYNEVGNRFGITSQGISEAMNSSATSLNAAGNTIEESVAMITAANTSIQDPGKIGEGLDTISKRLRGIGEDGEGLTEILPSIESKFASMGLTLKKSDNTYKSTYEIFQELSSVWNQLSSAEQLDVTQLIGGDQQAVAASILSNWQNAQGALQAGLHSFGSAARENEIYLDSLQGRIAAFTNAANSFWSNSLSSDFLKGVVNVGTGLIKFLDNLGNTTVLVTGLLIAFRRKAIGDLISGAGQAVLAMFGLRKAIETTGVAANATAVALTGMQRALGIFGILMTVGSLIYSVFNQISSSASKSSEEFENLKQSIENSTQSIAQLQGLNEQYKAGNKSQEELLAIRQQMAGIMPGIISHYNNEGNAVYKTSEEIDNLIAKEKELLVAKQRSLSLKVSEILTDPAKDIDAANKKIEKNQKKFQIADANKQAAEYMSLFLHDNQLQLDQMHLQNNRDKLKEMQNGITNIFNENGLGKNEIKSFRLDIDWGNNNIHQFVEQMNSNFATIDETINANKAIIDESKLKFIESFGTINQDLMNKSEIEDSNFRIMLDKIAENYINSVDISEKNKDQVIGNYRDFSKDIVDAISSEKIDLDKMIETGNFEELQSILNSVSGNFLDVNEIVKLFASSTDDSSKKVDVYNDSLNQVKAAYDASSEKISLYNKLLKDNSSETGLNTKEVTELIKKDQSLIELFHIENGHIKLNTSLVKARKEAELSSFKEIMEARRKDLENQNKNLRAKLVSWGIEVDAITTVAELEAAKAKLHEKEPSNWQDVHPDSVGGNNAEAQSSAYNQNKRKESQQFFREAEKHLNEMYELNNIFKLLSGSLDDSISTNSKSASTGLKDTNKQLSNNNKELTKTQQTLKEIENSFGNIHSNKTKYSKGSQAFRDTLNEEITQLTKQKKLYDEAIKDPKKLIAGTEKGYVPTSEEIATAKTEAETKSRESADSIYRLRTEIVESTIIQSDNKVDRTENNINKSKNRQSGYDNLSAEWRKEEMSQISHLGQKQKELSSQNENAKKLINQYKLSGGEFQQQIDQNNLEIEKIETEIQEKRYAVLVSSLDQYEQKRKQATLKIEASETRSSLLDSASPAYRKELEDQLTLKQEINKQNEAEIQTINEKLQNTKLLPKDVAALKERLELLEGHKLSVQVEIDDIKGDIIESQLEEYSDKIRDKDAEIKIIQDNLRNLEKGTPEYTQELMKQIPLIQDKIRLNQAEIAYLEAQTKRTDISIAKRKEYNQLLVEAKENNRSLMQDERSIRMEIADGIIEDYKKAINKQKELELSAIDEKMKAEDERHKEAIKHLDDEYKTFEKYINAQLKAMDRQNASDDYDKELAKKLKERQEIIDKINVLQLDNSMEAKAKRKDLQGQLDAKNEEIDEFKLQRDRETSKQTLQDLLDDRKEYLDQVRTHEDDQYEESREKNEQEKKDIERKYNSMLNDEKNFYRIKQGLLSEDKAVVKATTEEIKLFYTQLYAELEQALINHKTITQQEYNNIRDSFNQSNGNLGHYGNNGGTTGGTNGNAADSTITPDVAKAWSNYLGNKKLAEEHQRERMKYKKGSPDYEKISNRIKELSEENQKYRNSYKFKDGSYEELKGFTGSSIFNAASGGMTPAWGSEGKFLLAHEKELILNKSDTSNLLKIVGFTRKIIDSIKGSFNHDTFKTSSTSTVTDNSIRIDNVSIHADNQDTGTSLLQKFETALHTKLKHRTI
ncbi:phage tail tape measure protein [Paenibacillus lautus]|uniref:phage tail tape measure protein n=1 Tax=Paenibacillus lautus TaxID=1401 RepID=UPI003D285AF0